MSPKHIKEPRNPQLGNFVDKLRYREGLSRPELVAELHKFISPERPLYKRISEPLIKNIESGKRANISCDLAEALSKALHCTRQERSDLFLYAGHCVFVGDDNAPDDVAKMLHNIMGLLNEAAREMLIIRLDNRHAEELDVREQCEFAIQALRLLQRHLERS